MLRQFVKRNILWVGLLAVLVPLAVLLGLQYRWLVSLQKTSALAERAVLKNYLEAVSNEVEVFYYKQAWRALNVPEPVFFDCGQTDNVKHYFDKKQTQGARYLFVARYVGDERCWSDVVYYDPETREAHRSAPKEVQRATMVALAPWKTLAYSGSALQTHEMKVDERDPDHRVILRPISQDDCQLIGVAGMIVDVDHFKQAVLPAAIKESLPEFFDHGAKKNLLISVRDQRDRLVFGGASQDDSADAVSYRMPFIFSDWKLGLASRHDTPEQLARSNFVINVSLSVVLGFVLLGGVILALRTASREIRLSQMKSDFVSNVSHELRTPLASIRVFGEFLRLGRVRRGDKIAEYGEYIETESRRLTQLINNILDFSKIESGAKTYEVERADLRDVVSAALKTMEVSLRHKGFQLVYRERPGPAPELEVDREAVAQAVANLVDNAAKYSDGAKTIDVEVGCTDGRAFIAVSDQGIGISRDEQKKIFERFHRVSTGLVHNVRGSGLGLAIVHHIVQAHGGTIQVDSEPRRGSTFRILLPLQSPAEAPLPVPATAPAEPLEKF